MSSFFCCPDVLANIMSEPTRAGASIRRLPERKTYWSALFLAGNASNLSRATSASPSRLAQYRLPRYGCYPHLDKTATNATMLTSKWQELNP
jgi:hypothetical protein